jgi:hypothetical protein
MARFSAFGLDEKKRSSDKGQVGIMTCSFCWSEHIKLGFSMCFAHFCICDPCVKKGLATFQQPGPMQHDLCEKCQQEKAVYMPSFYAAEDTKWADKGQVILSNGICLDCLTWADEVLASHRPASVGRPFRFTLPKLMNDADRFIYRRSPD